MSPIVSRFVIGPLDDEIAVVVEGLLVDSSTDESGLILLDGDLLLVP